MIGYGFLDPAHHPSLVLSGFGWAFLIAKPERDLGFRAESKVGTASGMNTAAARTGRAMGVALSTTLFTYGLTAAGLSPPSNLGRFSEIFVSSFNHTVHIVNLLALACRALFPSPRTQAGIVKVARRRVKGLHWLDKEKGRWRSPCLVLSLSPCL